MNTALRLLSCIAIITKRNSPRTFVMIVCALILTNVNPLCAATPGTINDCAAAIEISIPFDSSGIIVAGQGDDFMNCSTGDGEDLFLRFLGSADTCLQLTIDFNQSEGVSAGVCVSLFARCPEGGGGTNLLSYQDSGITGSFSMPYISIQQDSLYFLVIESDSDSMFFDIVFDYMHQGCAESTCSNAESISLPFNGTYWISETSGDNVDACMSIFKYDTPEVLPSPGYDVVFAFDATVDTVLALTVDYLTGCVGADICFSMYNGCPGSMDAEMIFSNSIFSCNLVEIFAPVVSGQTYYFIMEYEPTAPATFNITIDYLCAYGDCYVFNGSGYWDDPARWDIYPGTTIDSDEFVIIATGAECTATGVQVNQGFVMNRGVLTVNANFTLNSSILMNTDSLLLDGTINCMSSTSVIVNYGGVVNTGNFSGSGLLRIENHGSCYNNFYMSSSSLPLVNYGYFENNLVASFTVLANEGLLFNATGATLSAKITNIDSLLNEGTLTGIGSKSVNSGYFASTTHVIMSPLTNTGIFESNAHISGDVQNSGTLKGSIHSTKNIINTGILIPGLSIGSDTASALFIQNTSGKTVLEIEGTAGGGFVSGHDHIVGINQTILNGMIEIQLLTYSPMEGDLFTLFEYDELLDDDATLLLPPLDSCLKWDVLLEATALRLSVISSPDTDGDGTQDCNDECPEDPLKTTPGLCGCGIADTDSNADGQPDCLDADVAVFRVSSSPAEGPRVTGHIGDVDSTQAWYLGSLTDTDSSLVLMNRRRDALKFGTGNVVHMTLDSAGRLGIGRIPTTNTLEVQGEASKSSPGDWLANSDARLKKNIVLLDPVSTLKQLMQLQGITYEWNNMKDYYTRPSGTQIGLTAQNIQSVFPSLVIPDKEGYLMSAYGTLDPIFIESIRALHQQILALTEINLQLGERIHLLEQYMDTSKPEQGQ